MRNGQCPKFPEREHNRNYDLCPCKRTIRNCHENHRLAMPFPAKEIGGIFETCRDPAVIFGCNDDNTVSRPYPMGIIKHCLCRRFLKFQPLVEQREFVFQQVNYFGICQVILFNKVEKI
jgi:hypothetical protein